MLLTRRMSERTNERTKRSAFSGRFVIENIFVQNHENIIIVPNNKAITKFQSNLIWGNDLNVLIHFLGIIIAHFNRSLITSNKSALFEGHPDKKFIEF